MSSTSGIYWIELSFIRSLEERKNVGRRLQRPKNGFINDQERVAKA